MIRYKKIIMMLALLLTAVTGAWATSNSIVINGTPQVGDKSISLTYHFDPGNVPGINSYAPSLKVKCAADNKWDETFLSLNEVSSGTTIISLNTLGEFEAGKTYEVCFAYNNGNWVDEVFQSFVPAGPATFPFPITWDATNKTTGFNLPAGNVFMNVEYYPEAALTTAPAAKSNIKATTADAIVEAGTVAKIGETTDAQGTLMYYAVQSETAPDAPDYDNKGWSDQVPTAADFNEGNVYVWYYVKGADGDAESTFNDGAITKLGESGYVTLAAPPTYAITLKEDTEEADKWTISPAEATKGTTITATYSGSRKVKSVKAVKKGGLPVINGKFSVSATKQVYFSKGNLRYVSGAWSFFDNQYDYYATYSADAWDKFGWSNSTSNFGMSTSTSIDDFKGDLVDWGTIPGIGSGWYTLSNSEWVYLFNTRSASTVNSVADARYAKGKVNGVYGIILFPDTYTHPTGVTLPVGINEVGNAGWNGNNYSAADWTAMETAGCVFLPATGYRQGTSVLSAGESCSYRSSSRANTESVKYVYFTSSSLNANTTNYGFYGQCVRLVQDVK